MAINFQQDYFQVEYDLSQNRVRNDLIKCQKNETGRGIYLVLTSNGYLQTPIVGAARLRYQTSSNTYSSEVGVVSGNGYNISLDSLLSTADMDIVKVDIELTIYGKRISSNTINVYCT